MIRKLLLLTGILAFSLAPLTGPASADGGKHNNGKGKNQYKHSQKGNKKHSKHSYKYEYRDGNCKYVYKETGSRVKEVRKCNGQAHRHAGGPPPWAPAHGRRAHRHSTHTTSSQTGYIPPFDIDLGTCNRGLLGSILGAAAGGLAGAQIGDGRGRQVAIAGGTLLGFLIGGSIGRAMDRIDQNCIGQTLEHANDGQSITWNNPQNGTQYQVIPTRTAQRSDGTYCREYRTTAIIGGTPQETYGRACRQPDGSWRIVQ